MVSLFSCRVDQRIGGVQPIGQFGKRYRADRGGLRAVRHRGDRVVDDDGSVQERAAVASRHPVLAQRSTSRSSSASSSPASSVRNCNSPTREGVNACGDAVNGHEPLSPIARRCVVRQQARHGYTVPGDREGLPLVDPAHDGTVVVAKLALADLCLRFASVAPTCYTAALHWSAPGLNA